MNNIQIHVLSILLVLTLSSCQSPFLVFAGKSLKGEERHTDSWAFARNYKLLQLETRPEKPYSVYLRVTVIGDELYIDAAESRRWHQHIKLDNRIRLKIGENVYEARAIEVEDPSIKERFLPDRKIYRVVSLN